MVSETCLSVQKFPFMNMFLGQVKLRNKGAKLFLEDKSVINFLHSNFISHNPFNNFVDRICLCDYSACHICHIWHSVSILRFKSEFLSYDARWRYKTCKFILFKLVDGNKILRARGCARYAVEYSVENSNFDENHSKILQNHIVIELDDLRASF